MEELRRRFTAEQPRQPDLAARGRQQILAANHKIYLLLPVVHCCGELIRPVSAPIANEQIAALPRRILRLPAKPPIIERFLARLHPHSPAVAILYRQSARSASPAVTKLRR